ncbi:hypothetical protein PY257_04380 [Ramlibacter sp. H39-3-26]|nr:hypothetical protein [Ramlibacter sp. H39-3-26]MDF1484423.1 hypothetical protein [Ramlibacter sp. H39-3-26]
MRGGFGLIGLVLALLIVGVLVKKQLAATTAPVPALQAQVPGAAPATGTVRAQSQQIQQQYKQAVEAAMQPQRQEPDEAK